MSEIVAGCLRPSAVSGCHDLRIGANLHHGMATSGSYPWFAVVWRQRRSGAKRWKRRYDPDPMVTAGMRGTAMRSRALTLRIRPDRAGATAKPRTGRPVLSPVTRVLANRRVAVPSRRASLIQGFVQPRDGDALAAVPFRPSRGRSRSGADHSVNPKRVGDLTRFRNHPSRRVRRSLRPAH